MHSKLSSKGQVTIPKEVRENLGLERGDFVTYELTTGDAVILRRVEPYDAAYHLAVSETLEEWGTRLPKNGGQLSYSATPPSTPPATPCWQ